MKTNKTLLILFFVSGWMLTACKRDTLPCKCTDAKTGILCLEEYFEDGKSTGYISYHYNCNDSLVIKVLNSTLQSRSKTIRLYYDADGKILRKCYLTSNIEDGYVEYLYNGGSRPEEIQYHFSNLNKTETFTYLDSFRIIQKEIHYFSGADTTVFYFMDENGRSPRIEYHVNGELCRYLLTSEFANGYFKTVQYNPDNQQEQVFLRLYVDGVLAEFHLYDENMNPLYSERVTSWGDYGPLTRKCYDADGNEIREILISYGE
ncbi:MAG: hypothetical protein KKA07_12690 [Bacteroidetes bacterium]|nr:hypothetical protein [Bacteroidota bacterium]MBU1719916.1 hypothetical protein [Bacteroidota bacterium]